ncbi:N-acetylmuramoyl-L-alanine amidase [Actinoplanes friuliensis]|uniref:Putative N-acetylmuramoyl-L-alanine amidase n=1 Tax=Actinoplanes friuliensis DSM 7358 TaxID=1246995 RepID=U5WA35_9ACTN|nr:N-acetylmuramoyl-L-alanine amidase [Actinoplanes friuliensis]AGZ44845.1 putative N-acetylmuramoyl-L-alanine amidase [Actinoplanes friuliensis DSM 7358]
MATVLGTAVALSGAVAVLASEGDAAAGEPIAPAAPTLQTLDLAPVAGSSPTGRSFSAPGSLRAESAAGARVVPQRTTGRFALVGATWADPRVVLDGTVEIRTRRAADGAWTGWQALESDEASPAEPGSRDADDARGSTDPLWVGESDGVEARMAADAGRTRPLPPGLRLDLINPGTPGPLTTPAAYAAPARAPRVATPPRPTPELVSRAGWGANEAIVKGTPEYTTDVQVVFVHHTAGTNSYRCSDSAAIIRSIEAYHVKSNHWDDIGYNFLVDKCGTLFEGRKGGVTRPVLGAHTLGFNARSSAIAVLGNYSGRAVPAAVKRVIAQVAAYKLGAYGNTPAGRVGLISSGSDRYAKGSRAMLNRISGHRDTGQTECPGTTLYAQLGSIRSIASAGPADFTLAKVNGATKVGDTLYTRGTLRPFWRTTTPSSLLNRFDVLVDGELTASAPSAHRNELLRLAEGRHILRLRAVALNGRMANLSVPVVVDKTLPEFTSGPSVLLRTGSLNGIVPVRLRWAAADAGGLSGVSLTSPVTATFGAATTAWAGSVPPSTDTTYALKATDRAGNVRSTAVTRTPVVASEALADRSGTWSTLSGDAYLGGEALRSTAANSSLSWSFTGRSASLAVSRTAVSGRVQIFVDGEPAGMIDLRSPQTLNKRAVWTRSWNDSDRHTVKIEVEGTAGRPGIIADGLVYLR